MRSLPFTYTLVILLVHGRSEALFGSVRFNPSDVFSTAVNVSVGAIGSIPDAIPSVSEILDSGKQVLAGYPFEVASTVINKICSTAMATEVIHPKITPDIANMSFILMTPNKNYTYSLLDADEMWKSPAFDKNKKTVILITGWTTDLDGPNEGISTISKAYFCRGDTNFVVVDSARYIDTLYTWSAFNTEEIGDSIATGLVELIKYVPVENIHLIGHSLGAHIAGMAGRAFNLHTSMDIPRITGLDPAKPCFNEGEVLSGIQRGDAAFIDIIHSNSGVLGKREPTGDVDFYPGGLSPLPPGCVSVSCAHGRAWEYYAETVYPGNEQNFMGVRCTSLSRLRANKCPGKKYPMGYAVPKTIRGNYFLEVNSESPYGEKAANKDAPVKCTQNAVPKIAV